MSNTQDHLSEEPMCEIIGCSNAATTTRWLIDEDRQLRVCWEHAEGDAEHEEAGE